MFTNPAQIFSFHFNPFALPSLIAIIINLVLLVLIQTRSTKTSANNWFSLVLVVLILIGCSEFLDRLSANPTSSIFWDYVGWTGWVFLPVTLFGFVLHFVGKQANLDKWINQVLIFGPALVFLFLIWTTNLVANNNIADNHASWWGWNVSPVGEYFWVLTLWSLFFYLAAVFFMAHFYFKAADLIRRKQALFILAAILIPILGGIITDAIFPIFDIEILPIGILLTTSMTISIAYSIIHYSLFVVSPTLAASTIVETISDALLVIRPNYLVEQVNQATLDLLGKKRDEVIGSHISHLFPRDEDWKKFLNEVLVVLTDQKILRNFETVFKTKDEKIVPVSFSGVSLHDVSGLAGIVGLARDVRKDHELEEMKLDFVSMAAHELRTPLTAIRGYLSLLEEELGGKLNQEQAAFLHKTFISSSQLASLIENLLAVSGIERGSMKIEKSLVDWTQLLTETVKNFAESAKQRKINLEFKKPQEEIPKVAADRFRMGEVLSNLVDNALNHTAAKGKVEISVRVEKEAIITSVKDSGEGIPEEALPKLFTKFFRVSGALEQGSKGTGLGLYISKAIVDMHEGKIWVESALGTGSTFSFSIPLGKEANESLPQSLDKFKELGLTHSDPSQTK